ncbi:hypothetical protein PG994_000820 [Apiospora phragmitis]|uniref:Uncharacterized protein n=1 Tax=Apiospora phragmitis TaxID=2905665 RepID=A0ABR1X7C0_9PEZI
MARGNTIYLRYPQEPLDPSSRPSASLFARKQYVFQQKHGRFVCKRELAEKHYSAAVGAVFVVGANPHIDIVMGITPELPYPKPLHHRFH